MNEIIKCAIICPMKRNSLFFAALLLFCSCQQADVPETEDDQYLWLEELQSEKALSWVENQNKQSQELLEDKSYFEPLKQRLLSILNSDDRIPYVEKAGKFGYNFWRDEKNLHGLFRRTLFEDYLNGNPVWETVLDLDALNRDENKTWTWKTHRFLYPTYDRLLISLSSGGGDAVVVREFDLETKQFVPDGFFLAEAKSDARWKDKDHLYVTTDFGPGSLTQSGYPKIVKEWSRSTPLTEAKAVFVGENQDVKVDGFVIHDHGQSYDLVYQLLSMTDYNIYLQRGNEWVKIDKPTDVGMSVFQGQFLFSLRNDWAIGGKTYAAESLLAIDGDKFLAGDRNFQVLFEPDERSCLEGTDNTKNFLVLSILDNMRNKVMLYEFKEGQWTKTYFEVPSFGSTSISAIDSDESDDYFMSHSDYITPSTLWVGNFNTPERRQLQSLPHFFSIEDLHIQQFEAASKDGTLIPYFQVSKKQTAQDGKQPTLLYGYGGFQIALQPSYRPGLGAAWLEQGGVYVEANIRGGGEFGSKWHEAARKGNRQRSFDDFIAVAEDLVARGVTSPQQLAIKGGSNGGLLMGAMLTQRPDLFKAVLCHVPLLDMLRYHKLLAGPSWIEEYGNPDKEEDQLFLKAYSPYHNLSEEKKYPNVLFMTSTKDDRVHPGHARKMAAKMQEQGHNVFLYENTVGGHAGATTNEQVAHNVALEFSFLKQHLLENE